MGRWMDRVMEDRETKRGWVALGDELGERERKKKRGEAQGWMEGRKTDRRRCKAKGGDDFKDSRHSVAKHGVIERRVCVYVCS